MVHSIDSRIFLLTLDVGTATLKNDDAEDSEEEEEGYEVLAAERRVAQEERAKKHSSERQPTGRIVGVIKRNWRS